VSELQGCGGNTSSTKQGRQPWATAGASGSFYQKTAWKRNKKERKLWPFEAGKIHVARK
jgi:hypothetical protein